MRSTTKLRALLLLAALPMLLMLPATGCNLQQFRIAITDFESADVTGIWMWREDAGGEFERNVEIQLGEPFVEGGVEMVEYTMIDAATQAEFQFAAPVVRDPANPDRAELDLFSLLWAEGGSYKASTYNEFGESPLSVQTLEVGS